MLIDTLEVYDIKILSWNCCCAFRNKVHLLLEYDADVMVIQECEKPQKHKETFDALPYDYYWVGDNENKGLCVFVKKHIAVKECIFNDDFRYFLSLKINNDYNLVAVWANKPYIEEYYDFQKANIQMFDKNTIIIGDFNSNAKWNKHHGFKNHSAIADELKNIGIVSAYHYLNAENYGAEMHNTFFQYRNADRGHHIDYCFASPERLKDFTILNEAQWLKNSDHLPLCLVVE